MDPITILTAFLPLVMQGGQAIIQKYFAPDEFKPASLSDYLAMRKLDIELFAAMNNAGGSNPSYPWVEAVIRLQRPFVVAVAMGVWASYSMGGAPIPDEVKNFAGAIGFYLFGDRTLFYAKKAATAIKGALAK